ncbi:MAG: DinB family protein [bacterium]|nr:DinB family protein [bacterium]
MPFDLESALQVLDRTPAVLDALLRDLDDGWLEATEGPKTWSPFDIVGHLIHGERTDWLTRARRILEHGTSKPFDPFDRFAQFEASRGKSMADLLAEFHRLRRENLEALRELGLGERELELRGTHPELGGVTLAQLLATWVTHDLGHIAQIARVMAKRNKDEVGAWAEYLSVLSDRVKSE